jgi:LPS-assembly lipoprotein
VTRSLKVVVAALGWISILICNGCGFHLRGFIDMPNWLNEVAITVEKVHRDLGPDLQEQLEAYHIHVNKMPNHARYWLILEEDFEEKHITSVSSSTTPRQYQVTYTVQFKLQAANGKDIIPTSRVTATRLVTINSDRILGSNYEENLLKEEMRHDAIIQIIDRLGHAKL